jgi:hypothetical protein
VAAFAGDAGAAEDENGHAVFIAGRSARQIAAIVLGLVVFEG